MSEHVPIPVIFDADGILVVDKPPGLETTGRTVDDPRGVQHHLEAQLARRVYAVHQLDRDTSGVLVFVRRKKLVAEWQDILRREDTRKRYLAVVHGVPSFERTTVDAALRYDEATRRWMVHTEAKRAITELTTRSRAPSAGLVEAVLRTGRTHQARVHLAHLGHPLFGEARYRHPPCEAHPRHALHAFRLETRDIVFESPWPRDLAALCDRLGLDDAAP